jgi:hypothetical protein
VFVTNQEKANMVAKTFSAVYHSHDDGVNSVTEQMVASSVESIQFAEVDTRIFDSFH